VSKRSKRRQGPRRENGEGEAESRRAAESGEAGGARQDEPRPEAGRRSPRSSGEERKAAGGRSPHSPGEARRAAGGRSPGRPGEARQAARVGARARHASDWNLAVQLAFLVAVFAVVVLIAELAGAANLGVALGVGQIAFTIAVIYLLLRR
jgi:hypothetical protein